MSCYENRFKMKVDYVSGSLVSMKKVTFRNMLVLVLLLLTALSGCNTARGFRTDVKKGIQNVRDYFTW